MTGMDDLLAFVRAQLDADEREAHAQKRFDAWVDGQRGNRVDTVVIPPLSQLGSAGDPDRVLAEVEAKRDLLTHVEGLILYATSPNYAHSGIEAWANRALTMLALPYAGRDGWREEWTA